MAEAAERGMRKALEQHEERRRDALDSVISELLWTPDVSTLGRVVRSDKVPAGEGFMLPGKLWADGKARLIVNTHQHVDEAVQKWVDAS